MRNDAVAEKTEQRKGPTWEQREETAAGLSLRRWCHASKVTWVSLKSWEKKRRR